MVFKTIKIDTNEKPFVRLLMRSNSCDIDKFQVDETGQSVFMR